MFNIFKQRRKHNKTLLVNTVSLRDQDGNVFYVTEDEYDRIKKKEEENINSQQHSNSNHKENIRHTDYVTGKIQYYVNVFKDKVLAT